MHMKSQGMCNQSRFNHKPRLGKAHDLQAWASI